MQQSSPKRIIAGLCGCLGAFMLQMILGSVYQWGIINVYITSYYKKLDPTLTLQANTIIFPVLMTCASVTIAPGLYISEKYQPALVLLVFQVLQAVCVFCSSFVESFGVFIVLFGVLFGLIAGFGFMIPVVQCNKYFPNKRMYINGFILMGTGIGPLVFGEFSYNYINPQKIPLKNGYYLGSLQLQQIANRVPACIRWLSLFYLIIGIVGCLLLYPVCKQNRKQELKQKQNQHFDQTSIIKIEPSGQIKIQESKGIQEQHCKIDDQNKINSHSNVSIPMQQLSGNHRQQHMVPKHLQITQSLNADTNYQHELQVQNHGQPQNLTQAICSSVYWVQTIIYFFGTCGLLMINVNYKNYVAKKINNDQFLTIMGVVGSIGSGLSRFFWSVVFNYTGYKFVALINLLIQVVIFVTLKFSVSVPAGYFILILLANCCFGGFAVITPTFSQLVFGTEVGSKVYGIYALVLSFGNFIQYIYVLLLLKYIDFDGILYICLGKVVIAIGLVVLITFKGPWNNSLLHLRYFQFMNQKK